MRRRAFNLIAVLSTLVEVAAVVFWIRSYSGLDLATYVRASKTGDSYFAFGSASGALFFRHMHVAAVDLVGKGWQFLTIPYSSSPVASSWSSATSDSTVANIRFVLLAWSAPTPQIKAAGFSFFFGSDAASLGNMGATDAEITTPIWFVVLISLIAPAVWLWHYLRRRRMKPGACRSCGYNLTGNTSGVCPECGTPISAAGALTGGSSP